MNNKLKMAIDLIEGIIFLVIVLLFYYCILPDLELSPGFEIFSLIIRGVTILFVWGVLVYRLVKKRDDFGDLPLFVEILIKVIVIAIMSCIAYISILGN